MCLATKLLNCITGDDVSALRFPASASNANCALRTLRRMLHKAEEWKLIFRTPKFRLVKEHGRSLSLDATSEAKLITAAALCGWRIKCFDLSKFQKRRNSGSINSKKSRECKGTLLVKAL
jgi:hypothetical protein